MADEEGKLDVKTWDVSSIEMQSERVPNVYSNNVQIGFSNWDAWIKFGEILGEHEGRLLVAPKVRVMMSLQHMKAFLKALNDSVAKFEDNFGEIGMFEQKETEATRKAAEAEADSAKIRDKQKPVF